MKSKDALERLRTIVGEEAYQKVITDLAGTTVYFPSNFEWQDKISRNSALKEDFFSGDYEISDLARKYDLSISHVYKIIQQRE